MSDISTIATLIRSLLGDFLHTMVPGDIFSYTTSSVFTLSESNVSEVSSVFKNDVELGSGDWSYDSATNKVTISASLTTGDTIEIQYTYYPNYSDTELEQYIRAAFIHLSINHYWTYEVDTLDEIYPEVTTKEQNLVAVVAAILIDKPIQSYRLPDISLTFPSDLNVNDKIAKTVALFKRDAVGNFNIL